MKVKLFSIFVFCILLINGSISAQEEHLMYSPDFYYNEGNNSYNAQDYGDAIYFYEKALILDPSYGDAKHNITLAKDKLNVDVVELESFFLYRWIQNIAFYFSAGIWKIISFIMLFAIGLLVYLLWIKKSISAKQMIRIGSACFSVFLLSIVFGQLNYNRVFNNSFYIIGDHVEALKQGPDDVSADVKDVTNGVKVKVIDEIKEWSKVATMDSEQGWVKTDHLRPLKFTK